MECPAFDEVAVREALLNAVAHRDYRVGASVFVRQYARRLEFVSPGGLPAGITPENILEQQNPRNRRLAEVFTRCGLIERSGQGMNLMFVSAIRQGKSLPSLAGTSAHEVRVTLDGMVTHSALVRFVERLGEERLRGFATQDFLVLDALARDVKLAEPLRARLPTLVTSASLKRLGVDAARGTFCHVPFTRPSGAVAPTRVDGGWIERQTRRCCSSTFATLRKTGQEWKKCSRLCLRSHGITSFSF